MNRRFGSLARLGTLSATAGVSRTTRPSRQARAGGSQHADESLPSPSSEPRLGLWLNVLCLVLLGYALAGKGAAYVGVPPLFVGEIVLACGLGVFIVRGRWADVLRAPSVWCFLLLAAWGVLRTAPYVSSQGIDALRDATIWGYGAFAILVFSYLLAEPTRLAALVRAFRRFYPVFLSLIPIAWILTRIAARERIPNWPWADAPIIDTKGGDIMVHAAGILAFWVAGLAGRVKPIWVALMTASVVLVGVNDRAGLMSFLAVFAVCFALRPRHPILWRFIGVALCGALFLAVSGIRVQMPGREREVSFDQLVQNVMSPFTSSKTGDLDATKEWRLEWWTDIVNYTVNGKYFWTGKGFGVNLADDDGYQVEEDNALRNPHNGHLTMLARAGVPGLFLWVLVQLSWAASLLGALLRSRRLGQQKWPQLFLVLLAYWMAFMINTSFDVYLEGPMGGIWYWTVYGVGLAAVAIHRDHPEALEAV